MRSTTINRFHLCGDVQRCVVPLNVAMRSGRDDIFVEARLVPVAPHIACDTFAAHTSALSEDGIGWTVSSVRTGRRVIGFYVTEDEAIAAATERLAGVSNEAMQARIAELEAALAEEEN